MNKNLMLITIESLAFLEFCGPNVVDRDVAISQMHQILSGLEKLTSPEKAEFCDFLRDYCDREVTAGAPPQRIRFLRSLPMLMGFVE